MTALMVIAVFSGASSKTVPFPDWRVMLVKEVEVELSVAELSVMSGEVVRVKPEMDVSVKESTPEDVKERIEVSLV